MSANITILFQAVEHHKDMILSAERHIWKNPESGYREWKTHAYMKEKFESLGYTVTEAGNIPGFYTDIDTGRPGPKLGIFAEMDSLIVPTHPEADPKTGAVHACAHHCQCAAMLGIAAAFKAPGALDDLCGSIRLIVVPAEELIEIGYRKQLKNDGIIRYFGGKQEFLYRGILDGVDLSMMVHTSSAKGLGCGIGSNGCVTKIATFKGKGAHAGGAPEKGINALYAANTAMAAANALRETFKDDDHIRFHPIITLGGDAVNAIPDKVVVESYVRGATTEAIIAANEKVNRAFAGAAAAMGCTITFDDAHGYAPRKNDLLMRDVYAEVGALLFAPEEIKMTNAWGTGCSDMGDINCVMPSIHPHIGGCVGPSHSSQFFIDDPYTACVKSAQLQAGVTAKILENGAVKAHEILEKAGTYPSYGEFLATIDKLCFESEGVTYNEDGTVTLTYHN